MAFMFIVTILVIAICRVHIKRTIVSRCPRSHQCGRPGSPLRPTLPLYDIDMFLDRQTDATTAGLLVTYNINNGVQFVGRPIDPPPYCEVIDTPPREGPPPPYVSRENLNIQTERIETDVTVEPESTYYVPETSDATEKDDKVAETQVTDDVSSSPSVSGMNAVKVNDSGLTKRPNYDTDSESDSLESDALLSESMDANKSDDNPKVAASSASISSSPPNNSFLNNITAVSKTLIGSLKRQSDEKTKSNNRQLITQKSFDGSDTCDVSSKVLNSDSDNFSNKVTHSVGDLSPVSAGDFERLDYLTLPLRESFIGVRNDEV